VATEVQIVNIALSWLGQNSVNALTDNQSEAKIMNANYATSRDKVLADHAWTFALRREVLAPVAAPSAFGAPNQFLIPSDVLRVQRVYRPSTALQNEALQNARWVREGQFIISNEAQVWAHFIFRETNTDRYSAPFVHALAARLAADTAMVFTENRKMFEQMEAMYNDKLSDAVYADGSQGRTEVIRSTKLTGVRTR
jgi:hypothetical protein